MVSVIASFKNLFKGKNIGTTHIILFLITALLGGLQYIGDTKSLLFISPAMKTLANLIVLLISFVITFFTFKFANRLFKNKEGLPQFSEKIFKDWYKIVGLSMFWITWLVFSGFVCLILTIILFALNKIFGTLIGVALLSVYVVYAIFSAFTIIGAAKNYEFKKFLNIKLPILYIEKTFKDITVIGLKYFGIGLLGLIILVIGISILYIMTSGSEKMMVITSAISTYFATLYGLAWQYCLVKVYQEKIDSEPVIDETCICENSNENENNIEG